ncbi:hypothetical protein V5739_01995 [Salinimicrobium sp. TIG7-5_MAKvit]|jgi:hypothetical protein|uniref:hypothetical protein n=1 Tax=Salinimicrobium sp. TIG7-5_MAKvit TaxID=3121289 RepID=UPI003C6E25DF
MIFSDELILALISCDKRITNSPKKSPPMRGSEKKKFLLESLDGQHSFIGFISRNQTFQENFSIGLVYNPKDEKGKIVLLRVNGPHGLNENAPHHDGPHVHLATADRINAGLRPEGQIETDVPYQTIEEAVQYFVSRIKIIKEDALRYFPPPNNQLDFIFAEDDIS